MNSLPKPSEKSVRVPSRTERFAKKRSTLDGTVSETWFARIPASVLLDSKLTAAEKAAYAVMALGVPKGSNLADIGMRLLGKSVAGKSPVTAARWIAKLEERGHIRRKKGKHGYRNAYEFTSPVFARAVKPLLTEQLPEEKPQIGQIPARQCGKCGREVKSRPKSGYCRTCVSDANRLRAWRAAQAELGPMATEEQIVHHLNIRKLTAGWRKVMRRAAA